MGEADTLKGAQGRPLFWSALAVVVAALLVYPLVQPNLSEIQTFIGGPWSLSPEKPAGESSSGACACQATTLGETISDCCCDYQTVNSLNGGVLHPLLNVLVTKPFFSYFKVKLWCDCPFWPDDGMCHLRDCSVCECTDDEIPETFRKGGAAGLANQGGQCTEDPKGVVDRTLETKGFQGWTENDNPWTAEDESSDDDMVYVDLRINPEKYTGYKGVSASRIWQAIYDENCFKEGLSDTCAERRVFYRLISGVHASIAVHIAKHYLVDEEAGTWGTNLDIYRERIHKYPERLQNLYFTFLFVLRAATKAADFLASAEYGTGAPGDDPAETAKLVQDLVYNERLMQACPVPFDEAQLWRGDEGPALKAQLTAHFRNISAIMDCVGCEKCRLWGKLQILGLATSMKILFSEGTGKQPALQRNEVIALINLLARLSESLHSSVEMGTELHREGSQNPLTGGAPIFSDQVTKGNRNVLPKGQAVS